MGLLDWLRQRPPATPAKSPELPEGVSAHNLGGPEFIGQQQGAAADLLHARFRSALSALPQVQRAYFCKLRYPSAESVEASVCVVSNNGEDVKVVEALAAVIRANVGSGSHIDVLFLTMPQEARLATVCQPFYKLGEFPVSGEDKLADLSNITCSAFDALPETEQRAFIIGVANGRGMTSGLFQAYAGAAEDMAGSPAEREAIASAYRTIRGMMEPLLTIDAASLLNGIQAACRRPELRDRLVIEALASVHLDASKALREFRDHSGA